MRRRTKAGHAACGAPLARARCLSANPVRRGCAECSLRTTAIAIRGRATRCLGGVRSSACIDCHRHPAYAPGGSPFRREPEIVKTAQYLSGGRMFGPFTSANRTPYFSGKPAGSTLKQFLVAMRKGHIPKDPPGELLQVMPWQAFGKRTEQDLTAIYEYLRAIPSLRDNPIPSP